MNQLTNVSPIILRCRDIEKSFHDGAIETKVLKGVDLDVYQGEQLAIVGSSGSGKSTLLHILGTLDIADKGAIWLDNQAIHNLSANQQAILRNKSLGFIYQFHHLLPEFNALENVAMPAMIAGDRRKIARNKAMALLEQVGLAHRHKNMPSELSGGERQRVAIARALINQPKLVLADEPTGNLDAASGELVYQLMCKLTAEYGVAFVVVTHDEKLASKMDRQVIMHDGLILSAEANL